MPQMEVHHVWFPTHGRMLRRIRKRGHENKVFHGQLISINPFRMGLVYETVPTNGQPMLDAPATMAEFAPVNDESRPTH